MITNQLEQEYQAFKERRGFCLDTGWQVVELSGSDRASFLHNFCTADIKKLEPGELTEAFVLNPKGKVLAFVLVACQEESLKIVLPARQIETLSEHLSKYIIVEDVTLAHQPNLAVVYCSGQAEDAFMVPSFFNSEDSTSASLLITDDLAAIEGQLSELGYQSCSKDAFAILRIEQRFPESGTDVTEDHLAQEMNRDESAISFEKGCYLGQETVARLDALGHTNRSLALAKVNADSTPEPGSQIEADGKPIGVVTSSAWSPKFGSHVILATLRKPFHQTDQEISIVDQDDKLLSARVV